MGRYSGSSGSGGGAGGAQAIINSVVPAGERIQRGDLVLVGADGKGYAAALPSDLAVEQAMRPASGGPQLVNYALASRSVLNSTGSTGLDGYEVVVLTNKNILVAGVAASEAGTGRASPSFAVIDPDGNTVISYRAISGLTGNEMTSNVSAVALPNGGFAIAYSSTGVMLAIFDVAGNLILPPFQVLGAYPMVRIALLANGNIAITAATTIGGANFACSVYSTNGVAIKAGFAVATSSYGTWHDRIMGVAGLTGGGFVVGYILGTSSSAAMAYFRIYDDAGNSIGGATSIWPTAATNIAAYCHIASIPDGGFAFAAYGNGVGAYLAICSAQGVLRSSINMGAGNATQNNMIALAVAPNGNVGAMSVTDAGARIWLWSPAKIIVAGDVIEPYSASAIAACGTLFFNEDNSACAAILMGGSPQSPKVFTFDPALNIISSWRASVSQINYSRAKMVGVFSSKAKSQAYMLFYPEVSTSAIRMVSNLVTRQAMTMLGVATSNAEKENEVGVQMTGITTLRRPFMIPWTTNQQGSNPPGQRMYAVGTVAVMSGIQPITPNPIN